MRGRERERKRVRQGSRLEEQRERRDCLIEKMEREEDILGGWRGVDK